jgi:hypothetical protein
MRASSSDNDDSRNLTQVIQFDAPRITTGRRAKDHEAPTEADAVMNKPRCGEAPGLGDGTPTADHLGNQVVIG